MAQRATLKDLVYENEAEVKARITSELRSLGATEFEQFCISLLGPLGYEQLQVTKRGADRALTVTGYFARASCQYARLSKRNDGGRTQLPAQR